MKYRLSIQRLHRYVAVAAGMLLIIIGITGSLLVWVEELDSFFNPQLLRVTPQGEMIAAQDAIAIAQKAYPQLETHRLTFPQQPEQVYTAMMVSPQEEYSDVYINPYNGEVLGMRAWKQTLGGFLINLHVNLLAGDSGMNIVGICGIALMLMGMTGVILWNGWRNLKYAFTIRWRSPWQLKNYDLHRVGGVLSVALLLLIAFTGTVMIFWTPFENTVYWLTGTVKPAEVSSQVVDNLKPMAINDLLEKAQSTFPDTKPFKLFPAKSPEDPVTIWMEYPQANAFQATIYLSFDRYTGEILQIDDPKNSTLAAAIINAQYILHIGHYGGWLTRSLYFIVGLTPLGLLITGLLIWQQRRWKQARQQEFRQLIERSHPSMEKQP